MLLAKSVTLKCCAVLRDQSQFRKLERSMVHTGSWFWLDIWRSNIRNFCL